MVPEDNPYACLGLLPGSSTADIKSRYRQLAKQYHPDANHEASAEDKLRALNAAYASLSNPARKAAYDLAFEARAAAYNAVYNPARVPPAAPRLPRRRPGRSAALGLAALFLVSAGTGYLFSTQNVALALSGLYSRLSSRSSGPDRPPPPYTFLPSHGAFDTTSSPAPGPDTPGADVSAPSAPNQAGLP